MTLISTRLASMDPSTEAEAICGKCVANIKNNGVRFIRIMLDDNEKDQGRSCKLMESKTKGERQLLYSERNP